MRDLARRRVLVVNDDSRLANSVRGLLSDIGYDTSTASDGREGLEILARWRADLVLLDLIMPRLDGWAFLRQLASRPASARPLVLVWSVAEADDLERARVLGAADCLTRAETGPNQLLDTIARLLDQSPAA
jgi:two-component system, OmpR family, response regulator MprA